MARYHLIADNGLVVNTVEWDGVTPYAPDRHTVVLATETSKVGDLYINGEYRSVSNGQDNQEGA